jgi:DNA-binding transcriptional LysR family regulator
MRLVQLFANEHPGLRFQMFALSSEAILERLAHNHLDLGVSYLERLNHDSFTCLELAPTWMGLLHDRRYFSLPAPLLSWQARVVLPLGLLSTGMHFRQSIDHGFRSRGLVLQPLLETDAVPQLLQAVCSGLCCAVVPLDSGLDELAEHLYLTPIDDAQTLAPLGLILRSHEPRSALADACFNEAKRLLAPSIA